MKGNNLVFRGKGKNEPSTVEILCRLTKKAHRIFRPLLALVSTFFFTFRRSF